MWEQLRILIGQWLERIAIALSVRAYLTAQVEAESLKAEKDQKAENEERLATLRELPAADLHGRLLNARKLRKRK